MPLGKLAYDVGLRDGQRKPAEDGMNSGDIWKNADPKGMRMVTIMNTVGPFSTKKEFSETFLEGAIEGHTTTHFLGKVAE